MKNHPVSSQGSNSRKLRDLRDKKMNIKNTKNHVWLMLFLPPVIFLIALIVASFYFGVGANNNAQLIEEKVSQSIPWILSIVLLILFAIYAFVMRLDGLTAKDIGWRSLDKKMLRTDIILGVCAGAAIGIGYIFALSPLMTFIQSSLGDYVPPGQLFSALGSNVLPFFVANVLLAPFVEESIFRGYAITQLKKRVSLAPAVLLSCLFFGLFHWAGGFWYIVLVGVIAGGAFSILSIKRGSLIAPYFAHLTLNLVEFLFVWLAQK